MAMRFRTAARALALTVLFLAVTALALVLYQAKLPLGGRPEYVALGSSFPAGAGLGKLQPGSPLLCARSVDGYPSRLARQLRLAVVDMSCGGAVTSHLLEGDQFFQGPQIRAVDRRTRLVTITVGGNDVGYVRDLSLLAARRSDSLFGRGVRQFWGGPPATRDFAGLQRRLVALIAAIRARAPDARIVLATYPAILPRQGTCVRLGLTAAEAAVMRGVGDRLAAITRTAARLGDATVVDMHVLGSGHDACAARPWTRGWTNGGVAPFHPTPAGAQATADALARVLNHQSE